MFCADCGKEVDRTISGSCATCFVEQTPLLSTPEVVDVELCSHCHARRVGKRWEDLPEDAPIEWAREDAVREVAGVHQRVEGPYVQIDETPQDEKHFIARVRIDGVVDEVDVHDEGQILVRQRKGVCDRCSRMFGNYFASIIQLRATERDVSGDELERAHKLIGDELDRQRAGGNRYSFLTKSGPMHGGWDYYLGDIEAARQCCRILKDRLGTTVQETAKLVGKREGDDVYRVTFLVRVRRFAYGDFAIDKDHRLYQVNGVHSGRAVCIHMRTHRKMRIPETELRRLGGQELVQDAVLVSEAGNDLQILDPETFKTMDVPRPEAYETSGESIRVVRFEEHMYLPAWAPT